MLNKMILSMTMLCIPYVVGCFILDVDKYKFYFKSIAMIWSILLAVLFICSIMTGDNNIEL